MGFLCSSRASFKQPQSWAASDQYYPGCVGPLQASGADDARLFLSETNLAKPTDKQKKKKKCVGRGVGAILDSKHEVNLWVRFSPRRAAADVSPWPGFLDAASEDEWL